MPKKFYRSDSFLGDTKSVRTVPYKQTDSSLWDEEPEGKATETAHVPKS